MVSTLQTNSAQKNPNADAADAGLEALWAARRRFRDYATVGRQLLFQRIVIYSSALLLVIIYYDAPTIGFLAVALGFSEALDNFIYARILKRRVWTNFDVRNTRIALYISTVISACVVSYFCVEIAEQQVMGSGHFLPLFLLVSASIFAAMNNHQLLRVLTLRLTIYVATILYIPVRDVWIMKPELGSEAWLNLFAVIFVVAFVLELSRNFLFNYANYLKRRKELEDKNEVTQAALEAKTRFLATVNHELRTPLTSIIGSLDIIQSGAVGEPPEKMGRLLEMASRNGSRLKELVDDLLFIQSANDEMVKISPERIDLGIIANDCIDRFQSYADKLEIQVDSEIETGLCFVMGDGKRLGQVITNLLSNAAKFSNQGGKVTVSLKHVDGVARLSVIDQGLGIPDGLEDKVFAEFVQLDSQPERQFEGSGLGLNISKRIIDAHQGALYYVSELGVGSTFIVDLECAKGAESTISAAL